MIRDRVGGFRRDANPQDTERAGCSFTSHYAEFYGDPQLSVWRTLSARDKAANIRLLWRDSADRCGKPSIVDIGCGDGAVIDELSHHDFGRQFVGLEISPSALACALSRAYAAPVNFVQFDGYRVPARDRQFDLAILSHVLEHVESPRLLLREAARAARHVFVEVPLEFNMRTPRDFKWTDTGHINLYNPLLIRHLIQSSGLKVLKERVTCPHRDVFIFQRPGWRGSVHWAIKAGLLVLVPGLASRIWTYHACLMGMSA